MLTNFLVILSFPIIEIQAQIPNIIKISKHRVFLNIYVIIVDSLNLTNVIIQSNR